MEIEKLLHVAEDVPLKTYVWGQGVVETLNRLLPPIQQITAEITGEQALELIRALPPAAISTVMSLQINLHNGRLVGEVEPVAAPENVPAPATPATPVVEDKKQSKIPLMIAGVIVLAVIMLMVVITATAAKTGTTPDEGVVKLLLTTLMELFKILHGDPTALPPVT